MPILTLDPFPVNLDRPAPAPPAEPDDHRPSFDFGARPDAWSEAFHLGFSLGLDGEDPAIPADVTPYEDRAFHAGLVAGSRLADREYDQHIDRLAADRLEDAFGEPADDRHPDEAVRSVGCLAARLA